MRSIEQRVHELLSTYRSPDACTAELLCDRHPADSVAFTIIEEDLSPFDLTYGELREGSARVAAGLRSLGIQPGDSVATLMGKSRRLPATLLAIWRCGAVQVPLFTAFARPAITLRLNASQAKLVFADQDQLAKLAPGPDTAASPPWQVVSWGDDCADGTIAYQDLASYSAAASKPHRGGGESILLQLFTSGTTGAPKGVPIPLKALASFHGYLEFGLDVQHDDVYWNAADPGWAYGLYFGILGPLASGRRSHLLDARFSAALTWKVLEQFKVTNFAAAPTVYRSLRLEEPQNRAPISLRRASSAGEPLTPDIVAWSKKALGVTVRDHYGQTEQAMMVANGWNEAIRQPIRAGSMGQSQPGYRCEILQTDCDQPAPTGTTGRVALDLDSSPFAYFKGYSDAPERTARSFSSDGRWYLTGDAGSRDEDGFFFFSARDDDVILMAGFRIGPFDVESVLVSHPLVAEAVVIGCPDERLGEVIEAFIVPGGAVADRESLVEELQEHVKKGFAAHAYPRRIHFVDSLPKTPSGKVQRFLLRKRCGGR